MYSKTLVIALSIAALCSAGWAQQNLNSRRGEGNRPQMDETTRAAFEACATQAGMPARGSGTRPTEAQHESFKACLTAKGITIPEHHGHSGQGGQRPPPPSEESESNTSQ